MKNEGWARGNCTLDQYVERERARSRSWGELFEQAQAVKNGGRPVHTPREILQQPWCWYHSARRTARQLAAVREMVAACDQIYLTGSGSSILAGYSLDRALQTRLEKPVQSVAATELILDPGLYLDPTRRGLLISFSRSGKSPESLEAARVTRSEFPEYCQLLITCNPASPLVEQFREEIPASLILTLDPSTCDQGLAMTSSFTSMVVCGQMLAFLDSSGDYLRHVDRLCALGSSVLQEAAVLSRQIGRPFPNRVCLLGGKYWRGAALEGALKILELTDGRVCSLAESFLGARHGPLSFIDADTLVLFLLSSDPLSRRYERDLMAEIRSKDLARALVGAGFKLEPPLLRLVDGALEMDGQGLGLDDAFRAPLDVLMPQTLALALSLALGLDPDRPSRRGAINRVVEGVHIYTRNSPEAESGHFPEEQTV